MMRLSFAVAAAVLAAGSLAVAPQLARSSAKPAEVPATAELPQGEPVQTAAKEIDRGPRLDEEALAPYFADGKLQAAHARFDAGLYADAWKLFGEADDGSPQVAYLRALAGIESGRANEAVEILEKLKLPALQDRVVYNLGVALERLGEAKRAVEAYRKVPEGSVRRDDATLATARMLRKAGDPKGALAALKPLTDRDPPPWGVNYVSAALFLAGELHSELGDKAAARETWLKVWSEHALSAQAEDAKQRADAIKGGEPTLAHKVARARGFLAAHKNREGTDQLVKILSGLKLPDPLACQAHFELGRGYRKMREHTKAIGILEPVVERCTDPDVRAKALYILGSSTSIVAKGKAVGVYETLAKDFADHSFADDALLYVADLHMQAGEREAARDALQRLVDGYPQGDYRSDALFRLYWIDREDGALRRGLASLRILERDYGGQGDSVPVERSLYWQARTLVELERPVEAAATYEKLIREHPAGYYAMLARGRVASLDPALSRDLESKLPDPPATPPELEMHAGALLPDPHFAAAIELIKLGFPKTAADELIRVDRKAAVERAGSKEPTMVIASLLDRVGARRAAHHVAKMELRELLQGRPEGQTAAHFRIAYPQAYRDLVERHATKHGVPPDLLQALMREESSLDPEIVSWAGAIGLTQLMPTTAQAVARQLKLGRVTNADLRDPDLNVRLGAAYLGSLLDRWGGNPALATASYNAGPGAVSRWLQERGNREMDEFVEEIPIQETRDYVKRVLKSFNAYRLTYGTGEERFLALVPSKANPKAAKAQ